MSVAQQLPIVQNFLQTLQSGMVIEIFTDGACSGNPGPGGWGAVVRANQQEVELSGGAAQTTNNRMEMLAAIESLQKINQPCQITVYTDSQYLKDGITQWMANWKKNGWKTADKKPVKNQDLWQKLDELSGCHTLTWQWVRGHNGHPENERADALARRAIIAQRMGL